jgi:murein DD-endopeptidase MepM/ murein hydrolase activator NlpD|tara:strand:- start:4772 stop:5383 length:612 start_codon:yes stop_codon:yes gene_type:complete
MEILYPVKPSVVTNPFGTKAPWYDKVRGHLGVDFRTRNESLEIRSVMDGKVVKVVNDVKDWFYWENGWKQTVDYGSGDPYGNNVIIDHGGYFSVYGHCSKLFVHTGQEVKMGTTIAHGGNTGHSMGNHLHFELRMGENNRKSCVNSLPYMSEHPFNPNEASEWAKEAQEFVIENKISDGTRPHENVSREELWVMLHRISKSTK